ncbi:hypothetical protein ACE1SV_00630 [Streptomyces sp. E-15]
MRGSRTADVPWCAQVGRRPPVQHLGQITVYAFGFAADLGGNVATLGDETAEDGGLLEHGESALCRGAGWRGWCTVGDELLSEPDQRRPGVRLARSFPPHGWCRCGSGTTGTGPAGLRSS